MLRFLFIMACWIISTHVLAMPCPNGTGILYKGDSLSSVLRLCGEPTTVNEYKQLIILTEVWTYYKSNNNTNIKMRILFQNDRLINIEINSNNSYQNLTSTTLCRLVIYQGNTTRSVLSACGKPTLQKVLESKTIEYKELIYNGTKPQTLVFEDSKLIDFK